jgi:hypothetical protein
MTVKVNLSGINELDFPTGLSSATVLDGTATINIAAGGSWSQLTSATGNLALNNAGFSTTFEQTSAVDWLWENITAATAAVTTPSLGAGATNANSVASGVLPLNVNVGDFVLLFVNTSSATPPTVSDNGSSSNTYARVGTLTQNHWGNGYVFMCSSAAHTATTITVTGGTVFSVAGATFINCGGIGATSVVTGTSNSPSNSVVTTANNSLVAGGVQSGGGMPLTPFTGSRITEITSGTTPQAFLTVPQPTSGTSTTTSGTLSGSQSWAVFTIELLGAVAPTNHASPILQLSGTYWTGSASAADIWSIQQSVANTVNGASSLTISHSGSSGPATLQLNCHLGTNNSDFAGSVSSASGTTVSVVYGTPYKNIPVVTVTPTTNAGAFYISAASASGFTITYATSGAQTFNYQVVALPN